MFEMLPGSEGKTVGVHAVGKLTDDDYKAFLPPSPHQPVG